MRYITLPFGDFFSNKYTKYSLWLMLALFFHYAVSGFISIKDITPDVFLLLVIWIALKEGRLKGIIVGFVIGLIVDIISGNIIGVNALTKTGAAFITSFFYKEEHIKHSFHSLKFIGIVLLATLIHNAIYYFIFININEQNYLLFYFRYCVFSAAYTTAFSLFIVVVQMRTSRINFDY